MIEVTISEIKADFSGYVNRAAYGNERVIITSRGRPKAVLMNIEELEDLEDALAALKGLQAYQAGETLSWEQVKAELEQADNALPA